MLVWTNILADLYITLSQIIVLLSGLSSLVACLTKVYSYLGRQ